MVIIIVVNECEEMAVYKIIFARNEVIMCLETETRLPRGIDIRYEQTNGQLIYAFVSAADEVEACRKAQTLIPRLAVEPIRPSGDPSSSAK